MSERSKNHLVSQMRWCVDHPEDTSAWPAFKGQVDRIIAPRLRARGRWRSAGIQDLLQMVWVHLTVHQYAVLRQFGGTTDPSLIGYLQAVAVTVAKDFEKRSETQMQDRIAYWLDDPMNAPEEDLGLAYDSTAQVEAAIWLEEMAARLGRHGRRGAAARRATISRLRLYGYTLAEMAGQPEVRRTVPAVHKIMAGQDALIRRWAGKAQGPAQAKRPVD